MSDTLKHTQWEIKGDEVYSPANSTLATLPSGYFEAQMTQQGIMYRRQKLNTDSLINFDDAKSASIIKEIQKFWESGAKFEEYGFLHRRGYLLHGPPGSGKTSIIQMVIKDMIERGGTIFTCKDPGVLEEALRALRGIEPARPVVCLFEDIDSIIQYNGESEILSLLDGENQIDHVLNIATTNFLKKLPERIKNRPRRFDRLFEIDMPTAKIRKQYLTLKFAQLGEETITKWVTDTEKFSFAAIAELVVAVQCMDIPYKDALASLKSMLKRSVKGDESPEW